MAKIIFLDLDDTLSDFTGSEVFYGKFDVSHMFVPGFFLKLKPIEGSLMAVRQIIRMGYDVHILSQPVAESAHSYSEKIQWIGLWFPELINKVHLTQDKGLFKGDYLIDDNPTKWKAPFEANGGKFINFEYSKDHHSNWKDIVEFLREELNK